MNCMKGRTRGRGGGCGGTAGRATTAPIPLLGLSCSAVLLTSVSLIITLVRTERKDVRWPHTHPKKKVELPLPLRAAAVIAMSRAHRHA